MGTEVLLSADQYKPHKQSTQFTELFCSSAIQLTSTFTVCLCPAANASSPDRHLSKSHPRNASRAVEPLEPWKGGLACNKCLGR